MADMAAAVDTVEGGGTDMNRLGETLIDMAIDIGYQMRQENMVCAGDTRDVIEQIYDTAITFELTECDEDYFDAVERATAVLYAELKSDGLIVSAGHDVKTPEPELYANIYSGGLISTYKKRDTAISAAGPSVVEIAVPLCRMDEL